jgi:patatin-like phospholipase
MEPILELATQITSHLWLFHELYPDEADIGDVLSSDWREMLEQQAAADYSRLQALLDLTGRTQPGDWDPTNPLGRFKVSGQKEEKLEWKAPLQLWRTKSENRRRRQEQSAELRVNAAKPALDVLRDRVKVLLDQGLPKAVDFLPDQSTLLSAAPTPSLLTREELFEKTANWLLSSQVETVCAIATGFVGCEDEKETATRGDIKQPAGSTATRDPAAMKEEQAERRAREFLMWEEINKQVQSVAKATDGSRETEAQAWKDNEKKPKERLAALLDPRRLRKLCYELGVPVPFSMVLTDELNEIKKSRLRRLYDTKPDSEKPDAAAQGAENRVTPSIDSQKALDPPGVDCGPALPEGRAFDSCLFGLALSGGGIRSATFALGLLQGMADRNILPYIDLISTVSGGGYIGSWLISWIKRRGSVGSVQDSMRGSASDLRLGSDCPSRIPLKPGVKPAEPLGTVTHNADPHADHVRPIRLLREYSRYLAPQAGAFSADTWTIATTWLRNTVLNLIVLLLFFGAALLLPRVLIFIFLHLRVFAIAHAGPLQIIGYSVLAGIPILIGCGLIRAKNLQTFGPYQWQKNRESRGYNDSRVISIIVPWVLLGAFLEVAMLWHMLGANPDLPRVAACAFTLIVLAGLVTLGLGLKSWPDQRIPWGRVARAIAIGGSVLVAWALIYWLSHLLNKFGENTERGLWIAGSVGIALMLLVIVCVVGAFIGLAGKALSDEQREWWSRMGAWVGQTIVVWLVLGAICFFMPLWIALLGIKVAAAGIGWAAITSAGVKLAFSAKSGRDGAGDSSQNWFYALLLKLAPPVFVLGVLSLVSFFLFWGIEFVISLKPAWLAGGTLGHELCCTNLPISFQSMKANYWPLMYPGSLAPIYLMLVLFGLCLLVAWRVDINEFSMHHFYKNRLVRAYLGASRARSHRYPNAFTGFDLEDDIRLWRFRLDDKTQVRDMAMDCKESYVGPYPIINTAVNITRGADLGIQERKAESFIFTPLWSGFDFSRRQIAVKQTTLSEYAFQRTDQFAEPENHGARLGTAMAISGAAFNSNAGFHTSPALAFLLTVFGVRLGWWAGNPRGTEWRKASPGLGLLYLIRELTADTNARSPFVLLSDGGHFENMALYELIRRRCRFIVLSDAEEDPKFKLEGIGGAIRKCRDDFGVVIDLNIEALEPIGDPAVSRLHYSLGTIIYPGEAQCGKLLYIKSSVTGDEPVDVIEFRKRHSEFPHTSTVDQFFDESHFESYRALGHHIASEVFSIDMEKLPLKGNDTACHHLEEMFKRIESDWEERLKASKEKQAAEERESVTDAGNAKGDDAKSGSKA